VTLPAFATERRLSIDISCRGALSSKPTARRCCCRLKGQTDGRPTVIYTLLRIIDVKKRSNKNKKTLKTQKT